MSETELILRELTQLRTDLTARHDDIAERLEERQEDNDRRAAERDAEVDKRFDEIVGLQKITNGRVTKLELWRHGLTAVAESRSWIKPWVLGVVSGAIVAGVSVGIAAAFAAIT